MQGLLHHSSLYLSRFSHWLIFSLSGRRTDELKPWPGIHSLSTCPLPRVGAMPLPQYCLDLKLAHNDHRQGNYPNCAQGRGQGHMDVLPTLFVRSLVFILFMDM